MIKFTNIIRDFINVIDLITTLVLSHFAPIDCLTTYACIWIKNEKKSQWLDSHHLQIMTTMYYFSESVYETLPCPTIEVCNFDSITLSISLRHHHLNWQYQQEFKCHVSCMAPNPIIASHPSAYTIGVFYFHLYLCLLAILGIYIHSK